MSVEIDASNSQGFVNQPSGPVNQHFGDHIVVSPGATLVIQPFVESAPPFTYCPRLQRMIEDYKAVFGGRDTELDNLDAWLNDPHQPWCLLLAPTGRGKTALLIHWALRLLEQSQVRVAFYSISLRYETATAEATFRTLAHTLASWHNEPPPEGNTSPDHLRLIVANYLHQPLPNERPAIILLDGLDEAIDWQVGRDIFPRQLPSGVKVLASARQLAHGDQATWLERLGWQHRQTRAFALSGLERTAVVAILKGMGDPLAQLATDVDVVGELYRVSEGDPLTIRLLVEALQNEELTPEQLTRQPKGLAEYLEIWLRNLEETAVDSPAVYSLLNACATSWGPLTTTDLATLAPAELGTGLRLRQAVRKVERFIIGNGQPGSGYVFSHPRLREAFVERLLPDEVREWRERFVAYGRGAFANLRNRLDLKNFPIYVRQFWLRHLANGGIWEELEQVLNTTAQRRGKTINLWAELRHTIEGSYAGYLADLDLLWRYADTLACGVMENQEKGVAIQLRCALIVSSIHSLVGNLSPELLIQLTTMGTSEGKWYATAALEYIRQQTGAAQQAQALTNLAPHLSVDQLIVALEIANFIKDEFYRVEALAGLAPHLSPKVRTQVLADALETTRAIKNEADRANALTHLPPLLQPELLPVIKETALTIQKVADRAKALTHLIPFLPPELRVEVLAEALAAARATKNDKLYKPFVHVEALAGLNIHLPPELRAEVLAEALASAQAIELESHRAHALISLAIHLPPEELRNQVLTAALEAARAIELETNRAETLTNLAPLLPTELQTQVLVDAIAAAQAINDSSEAHRAKALIHIAPLLPPELLLVALKIARAIKHEAHRAEALAGLFPYLPPPLRTHIVAETMEATRAIFGKNARVYYLPRLAANLPPELGIQVLTDALEAARAIKDEFTRAEVLIGLNDYLSPDLRSQILAHALEITHDIKNEDMSPTFRARALTNLTVQLPLELRSQVLTEGLEAARAILGETDRARALTNLVVHLPPELRSRVLAEALEAACAIVGQAEYVEALICLVPHLPPELQSQLLAEALTVARSLKKHKSFDPFYDHVKTLIHLAPHLPAELRTQVLSDALEAARAIKDEFTRDNILTYLAAHLPPELGAQVLADILESARTIEHETYRAEALTCLLNHLPTELRTQVLTDALEAARAIEHEAYRAEALTRLLNHLPAELRTQVLTDALEAVYVSKKKGLFRPHAHVKTVTGLAPYLSPEPQSQLLVDALAASSAIEKKASRSAALNDLSLHLTTWTQAVPTEAYALWCNTLPTLARRYRQTLLDDLQALLSWIKALGGTVALQELARAIMDVGGWWP